MIPPDGDHRLIARRWVLVADRDIRSAEACLAGADPIPEAAAYHCQQAAEKLIKGLLVLARTPFRKTHDMEVLRDLVVPAFPDLTELVERMVPFSDWGHAYRYPGLDDEPIPTSAEFRLVLTEIKALAAEVTIRAE